MIDYFDEILRFLLNDEDRSYMKRKSDGFENCIGIRKSISQVIFEKDHCIIIDNFGNRYISKPEKGEKYDKEKGFLVALAKYNGFTTSKVHDLIENAVDKDGKNKKNNNNPNRNKKQSKKD